MTTPKRPRGRPPVYNPRPVRVNLSLSEDEAQRLDDIRGLAPRGTWVRDALLVMMAAEGTAGAVNEAT
jgi:hypothetical protein